MSTKILVTAATGNIGKELVPLLVAKNIPTIATTSSSSKASTLFSAVTTPSSSSTAANPTIAEGDIKNPRWLESQLRGCSTVFINIVGEEELFHSMNALSSAQRAGVKHVIFLSAAGNLLDWSSPNKWSAANFACKITVEQFLAHQSEMKWTVIGPSSFYGNDLLGAKMMLENGLYTTPFGETGISKVDEKDIAAAIAKVVEEGPEKHHGKKYHIGSKKFYKGSEIEALWSEALGKKITMIPNDDAALEKFEDTMSQVISPAWGRTMRLMFEGFREAPWGLTEEQYQEQVALLGREPSSYDEWVKEAGKNLLKK